MSGLHTLSETELLAQHVAVLRELKRRGTINTTNNPVGDYAETLFCRALNLEQSPNSQRDVDATDPGGIRYQIKGRRLTLHNPSRQLGDLRRIPDKNFDVLAAVLFNEDFSIMRVALIPHFVVAERSKYVKATNSWRFILTDNIWSLEGVEDVTEKITLVTKR